MGATAQLTTEPHRIIEHRNIPGNLLRGALIGTVETIPGVSGGTVALVVGIYDELIDSASHVVSAGKRAIVGPDRVAGAKENLVRVHWRMIIPVMLGMVLAVFTIAGPMSRAVEAHPEVMRALFFGMVLVSAAVPIRLAGRNWRALDWLMGLAGFLFAFFIVSIPPTTVEPNPAIIVLAAAIAVSALLLPGLSGSFILLTIGLYQPTLQAVDELDLGYLGLFMLGAVLGMAVIVKGLQWLLAFRYRPTMVVLAGLMLGALRALWPWQVDDRTLEAPGANWPLLLLVAALGGIAVGILLYVDHKMSTRRAQLEAVRVDPDAGA
ncbi:DUF368 domain-containing protein [Kocuria carniphila]|uniref:DUF368 domain-containing protein n=1 Tax=Kocuria carniphila TaxID=262208 RepID=UPI0021A883DD|nr:DUF368 domain-containing protein [Kocuria carniphila]MCT1803375.1 DUF368 domain-containing protein [Kocuria carniphila]